MPNSKELGDLFAEWLSTIDNTDKDYHWDGCYGTLRDRAELFTEEFTQWLNEKTGE